MKKLFIFLLCLPGLNFAQTPEDLRSRIGDYSISAYEPQTGPIAAEPVPQRADGNIGGSVSDIFGHLSSLNLKMPSSVTVSRSGNAIIIESSLKDAYSDAYKYGDVAFLIGNLDNDWTEKEWTRYYEVAKWLINKGFRVVMNPVAMITDIKATVQDQKTKAIIWSSHGSKDGYIYDAGENAVPTGVFAEKAGSNLKQIVVSACYSNVMVNKYSFRAGTRITHWTGTTTSDALFDYLISDDWNPTAFGVNNLRLFRAG